MTVDLQYYGSLWQFNFVRLIQQVKVIENRKQLSPVAVAAAGLAGDGGSVTPVEWRGGEEIMASPVY